jgi:hypothetical protein
MRDISDHLQSHLRISFSNATLNKVASSRLSSTSNNVGFVPIYSPNAFRKKIPYTLLRETQKNAAENGAAPPAPGLIPTDGARLKSARIN